MHNRFSKFISRITPLRFVAGLIGISVVVWLSTTVGVAVVQGDGVSKFTGIERGVAAGRLNIDQDVIDNKSSWAYYFHVDAVYPTPDDFRKAYCKPDSEVDVINLSGKPINSMTPDSPEYYTVEISHRHLFGYKKEKHYYDGCLGLGITPNGVRPY